MLRIMADPGYTPPPTTPWDDYRLVRVLAEAGTIAAAAGVLRVNASTVFRRLRAIEAGFGTAIFERGRQRYTLTPVGEEMVVLARGMEERIQGFERRMAARDVRPSGRLCVTIPDSLLVYVMAPVLADFCHRHPEIELDVIAANSDLDLSRREADVAIRATDAPPESLVGRRLCSVGFAAYVAEAQASLARQDLDAMRWVTVGGGVARSTVGQDMEAALEGRTIAARMTSLVAIAEAIAAGLGPGYLPCWIGDHTPGLVRLAGTHFSSSDTLWLLTHADLRHSLRVRAFLDHAWEALSQRRAMLEGTAHTVADRPAPIAASGR